MSQHDPLLDHDRQQAAPERGERITLADLSPLEREALALLRWHSRHWETLLGLENVASPELRKRRYAPLNSLVLYGLVEDVPNLAGGFYRVTADGARLQAELFAQGGAE